MSTMPDNRSISQILYEQRLNRLIQTYEPHELSAAQEAAIEARRLEREEALSPELKAYFKTRDRKSVVQHVLCFCFAVVYRRWLYNDFYGTYDRVLKVTGWRSARVATYGKRSKGEINRRHMSPCFWGLN